MSRDDAEVDAEVDALIESVTSGQSVDWDRAEASARDERERTRIRAYREVASVADFHRTLQRGPRPGAQPGDEPRWGELLLLEQVGAGANGDVHRAWDAALQREVALKLLRPSAAGARDAGELLDEARALARVQHPGVVAVYGVSEHGGRAGLWMEYLHGVTLEAELARRGALPAAEVARLGAELARALAAVHAAGVLHRDFKPANIMLAGDGRVVLMDFGLGQRRFTSESDPGVFSGTPMFMSPARLNGASATPADDLYALGVTLRCALSGAQPFHSRTLPELRNEARAGAAVPLAAECPGAPAALVAAIERAMAPEPAARFATATALAEALEDPSATTAAPPAPAHYGQRTAWQAGLALVTVLVAIAWFALAPRRPAAVATPGSAPTVAIAAPYDVSAGLVRRAHGTSARLDPGDRVRPGDKLSLEFHATRPAWVYVLDSDDRGETYLLFPQPLFDRHNPIAADSLAVLPGSIGGRENAWTVTSRGGHEHFLIVASPEPVAELEAQIGKLPAPRPGRPVDYARVEPTTVERLRGVGGISEVPSAPVGREPTQLFDRFRRLAGREAGVRGTWVRQVTLENPLR